MKNVFIVVSLVLVIIAIPVGIFLVRQRQQLSSQAAPSTTFSLVPSTADQIAGKPFDVTVNVSTGDNSIVNADIFLSYDPTVLEATSIVAGDFFSDATEAQKSIDTENGKIVYSVYTQASNAKSGEGTLAIITFQGKANGSALVSFDPQSYVGAVGNENQSVLTGTTPATFTITGGATIEPTVNPTTTASSVPATSGSPNANPTSNLTFGSPTPTAVPTGAEALSVTSIQNGETVETLKPVISGKAAPYATVTITLYSTPTTVTVTADANGNWSWTPTTSLETGSHSITVASGAETETVNFSVGPATPSTGVGAFTIVLAVFGFVGLLGTFLLAF